MHPRLSTRRLPARVLLAALIAFGAANTANNASAANADAAAAAAADANPTTATTASAPTNSATSATTASAPTTGDAADDPCAGFKWDISQERRLFAGKPAVASAGKRPDKPAVLVPDRLFELRLAPHERVKFPVPPGLNGSTAGTYAGLAIIQPSVAGTYRIAVDRPLWIDVDLRGQLLSPKDFEGAHGCSTPRKIVVFELTDPQPYVLQFSGAHEPHMRVTVTREP